MVKYVFLIPLATMMLGVISCSKNYQEVFDLEQPVQVLIGSREFLVPKKYIDNPSLPVKSPLVFDHKGSMIAYFYFPTLDGLTETDTQQRFGRFNHQVISMQWYNKKEHYIDAKRSGSNILERVKENKIHKYCQWSKLECFQILDVSFYEWVGSYHGLGSFYIRCHKDRNNPVFVLNQVCNLYLDYDDKNLYIESLISSNFIASQDDLPKVMMQMKKFIDNWEVHN